MKCNVSSRELIRALRAVRYAMHSDPTHPTMYCIGLILRRVDTPAGAAAWGQHTVALDIVAVQDAMMGRWSIRPVGEMLPVSTPDDVAGPDDRMLLIPGRYVSTVRSYLRACGHPQVVIDTHAHTIGDLVLPVAGDPADRPLMHYITLFSASRDEPVVTAPRAVWLDGTYLHDICAAFDVCRTRPKMCIGGDTDPILIVGVDQPCPLTWLLMAFRPERS